MTLGWGEERGAAGTVFGFENYKTTMETFLLASPPSTSMRNGKVIFLLSHEALGNDSLAVLFLS